MSCSANSLRMSHGYSPVASISAARGRDPLVDDLADRVAEVLVLLREVVDVGQTVALMRTIVEPSSGCSRVAERVTPAPWPSERRIFLIAVGAILRYAVTDSISGVDLATIGLILMIVGIVGL